MIHEAEKDRQHYVFAHLCLRDYFFNRTREMFLCIDGPHRDEILNRLWRACGIGMPPHSLVEPKGLKAEVRHLPRAEVAIVTLPDPRVPAHAVFVACIHHSTQGAGAVDPVEFFTLELGQPGQKCWLCSWTRAGVHRNFGAGYSNDKTVFIELCLSGRFSDTAP